MKATYTTDRPSKGHAEKNNNTPNSSTNPNSNPDPETLLVNAVHGELPRSLLRKFLACAWWQLRKDGGQSWQVFPTLQYEQVPARWVRIKYRWLEKGGRDRNTLIGCNGTVAQIG